MTSKLKKAMDDLFNALTDDGLALARNPDLDAELEAPLSPVEVEGLSTYYVGLLPEPNGANDEWWQDAMRAELGRAHDFYVGQFENTAHVLKARVEQAEQGQTNALTELTATEARRLGDREGHLRRIAKLETALRFYADQNHWLKFLPNGSPDDGLILTEEDKGQIARTALSTEQEQG